MKEVSVVLNSPTELINSPQLDKIRDFMRQGQHKMALALLIEEQALFPHNLYVLNYLASCYYMAAEYSRFKKYTYLFQQSFEKYKCQLSSYDYYKMLNSLVKLLEEMGEVSLAIKLLKPIHIHDVDFDNELTSKLLAQKLRLIACYESATDSTDLYQFCAARSIQNGPCYIDHETALMLADCYLFGLNSALERLSRFIQSGRGHQIHRRFLVFDLLCEALKMNKAKDFPTSLLEDFIYLEVDPYEKILWDLYCVALGTNPYQDVLPNRIDGLSPMSALRVLHLLSIQQNMHERSSEISKKLGFYLNGLSSLSRRNLADWFLQKNEVMSLNILKESVQFKGQNFSTNRSPTVQKILLILANRKSVPTDTVISELNMNGFTESNYAKLRMAISRANTFILKLTGQSKTIMVNKDSVSLLSHIEFLKESG